MKKKTITKSALALSVFMLILWCVFGAGTSLAWFVDTTPAAKNSFIIGDLNLTVYHKTDSGAYDEIVEDDTVLFDDEALYEPGYTQVIYLKVVNNGDMDFDYKFSVIVNDVRTAKNVDSDDIFLPEHLKFGAIFGSDEAQLERAVAQAHATMDVSELALNSFSQIDSIDAVESKDSARYVAIIVYMPEEIGNEANYRDELPPKIELGISILASQKGTINNF